MSTTGNIIRSPNSPSDAELEQGSISKGFKDLIIDTAKTLKGSDRRIFEAKTVKELGRGGQRLAEKMFGWCRKTIRKGTHEAASGFTCIDAFSMRGRKKSEELNPKLIGDIKEIAGPYAQTDPTFKSERLYLKLTAKSVRQQLIDKKGYTEDQLPGRRTISTILNKLGYKLKRVGKTKPLKKIPETDAIFEQVHKVNKEADQDETVLRLSMDAKAVVKIGNFSRGGMSRLEVKADDHDFKPDAMLTPFNILLPKSGELFIFFLTSFLSADAMIDCLEHIWPDLKDRYNPTMLVINMDNGPENNSRRTQFIKRIIDFSSKTGIKIRLAYYPPYHSKYNPVERTHAAVERNWSGTILKDIETAVNCTKNVTWKGMRPVVELVDTVYEKGVKLTQKAMDVCEHLIERLPGLEKWFVDISPFGQTPLAAD